jgi:hypothetical protein
MDNEYTKELGQLAAEYWKHEIVYEARRIFISLYPTAEWQFPTMEEIAATMNPRELELSVATMMTFEKMCKQIEDDANAATALSLLVELERLRRLN